MPAPIDPQQGSVSPHKHKIVSAAEAALLVHDGDTVATSGFVGIGFAEGVAVALEARFLATGAPARLSLVYAAGQGDGKTRGLNHFGHRGMLRRVVEARKALAKKAGFSASSGPAAYEPASDSAGLQAQAEVADIRKFSDNADVTSLMQTLLFGLKGLSAYADHAAILGQESDEVYAFIHEAMAATLDQSLGLDELIGLCLGCGAVVLAAVECEKAWRRR